MKRVLVVLGTRPEAIKLAPVVAALRPRAEVVVCSTGQHRELLDGALRDVDLSPDIDLEVMAERQSLSGLLGRMLQMLGPVLEEVQPDVVVAQGDTSTVLAASLAAFSHAVPFAHVEAGLRTDDRTSPFPEEFNRRVAGLAADLHFVPTERARAALLAESVPEPAVFLTGNTIVDALLDIRERARSSPLPAEMDPGDGRLVLVTAHRRESFGRPFRDLCEAIREISERHPDVHVVFPVHLNPNVRLPVHDILGGRERIRLVEPVSYPLFVALMDRAHFVLTDSGGVQEEAPTLGTPVLVLREKTERPEAVAAGSVRLVGTDRKRIVEQAGILLTDRAVHAAMATARDVYGDGLASRRIAEVLIDGRMRTPPFRSSTRGSQASLAAAP